jgi:hypothetical protein
VIKTKTILRILLLPLIPLSVPAAAMLFKAEGWGWSLHDFVIMWVLMAGAGFAYALATRSTVHVAYRVATAIALVTAFLLVWVNGAVGIIGSDDNPANAMYAGVLIVGFLGAILARLRPDGMARTLLAMALAQLSVPVIALFVRKHDFSPGIVPVFVLNAVFSLFFIGAALLFRHAARQTVAPVENITA